MTRVQGETRGSRRRASTDATEVIVDSALESRLCNMLIGHFPLFPSSLACIQRWAVKLFSWLYLLLLVFISLSSSLSYSSVPGALQWLLTQTSPPVTRVTMVSLLVFVVLADNRKLYHDAVLRVRFEACSR